MSRSTTLTLSLVIVSTLLLTACMSKNPPQPVLETKQVAPQDAPAATSQEAATQQDALPAKGTLARVETSYQSPGGVEAVAFALVVNEEGIITDATTEVMGKNPTTIMRQTSFAKDFPAALEGKKLSALTKVDRIGGSSLTTGAFNAALDDLKAQL